MPHAWRMWTPWRSSKACISDSGTADPPHATVRRLDRSGLLRVGVVQEVEPDRGHAAGHGHALRLDQLGERLALEEPARHHEVGPGQRRRVREAPRVRVEHRHDREHAVGGAQAEVVGDAHGQPVQDLRPVRVQDALRVAGRAARVAEAGGRRGRPAPGSRTRRAAPQAGPRSSGRSAASPRRRRPSRRSARPSRTSARSPRAAARASRPRTRSCPRRGSRCRSAGRPQAGCSACAGPRPSTAPRGRPRGAPASSTRRSRRGRPRRCRATSALRTAGRPGW